MLENAHVGSSEARAVRADGTTFPVEIIAGVVDYEFRDMLPKSKAGKLFRREIRDEERRKQ